MLCPECGVDLTGRNPRAHALSHYPEVIEPTAKNKEARKRQQFLYDLADKWGV